MKKITILTLLAVFSHFTSTALAAIIKVPLEYAQIQQAIDAAGTGDIIIVSPGTYSSINFKGKALTVTSANPDDPNVVADTIIDAGGVGSAVTFAGGEARDSVLQGFTITGGTGTLVDAYNFCGGGIYCYNSSPTIRANVITENYCLPPTYEQNGLGGGICCYQSHALIDRNIITANEAFLGGGIYTEGADTISNNLVYYNTAELGGGAMLYGGRFVNNTLTENSAWWEAGNLAVGTGLEMLIANNLICSGISSYAGGICWYGTGQYDSMVHNNVWGNAPENYFGLPDQTGHNGNISQDPLFVDARIDDYHLQSDSPCINAGDPAFVPEPNEKDIDGQPRVVCTRVDIGADEYVGSLKPTADAGPDQFFKAIVLVTLDGTGSFVCDSCAVTEFSWTQTAGPDVTLSDAAALRPTFMPEVEAEYWFELAVSDGLNTSQPDQVLVVVGNRPPVADAGPNTVCRLGQQVHLDGAASYDPDPGDPLTYAWRQVDGPNVVLYGTDTPVPYYDCNQEGVYAFELVVSDGLDHSRPGLVHVATIEVAVNQQPLYIEISNFNHNGDVSGSKVIYAEGSACDFGWTNECRDLKTGTVISFDGGGLDTQPKIDGDLVVWFGGPEFGEPWYHEPLNTSVLVRDLTADENIILRHHTMSSSYTHPVISGRKVVWLEHHNLDTQPLGSPQANNWWNTPYNICGADITDLDNPVYFTIDVNVGRRHPYACLTYHSDFDDVIDICGSIVVWEADGDIYGADITDLSNIKVFPICTQPARQYDPAISGNIVVWVDERNDAGDIYAADISDTENLRKFELVRQSGDQKEPSIDGCLVVYVDVNDGLYGGDIKVCCLTKRYGAFNIDLAGSLCGMGPAIDGETIIWQDSYFGKAQGMALEVSYSIPGGKIRNLATGRRYDYFQHAINTADPGAQIVAAPALYTENFRFKGKNLTVRSTEPNDPVVRAATVLRGTSRRPVVTFTGGEDTSCVLAGFTITGGHEGISCLDAWPVITNCKVTGNTGAGIKSEFSQPRFLAPVIVNCTIVANEGDGVWARGRITPALTNCLIAGNKGAGVDTHQLSVISNCTIVENGLAGISSYNTIVTNSIVWGNSAPQIVNPGLYSVVAHSDVQGGYSGAGNINVDPCFVEPGYRDANGPWVGGDYHLLDTSECVDLADNAAVPADITDLDGDANTVELLPYDLDGRPRIIDGDCDDTNTVDMGAYEFAWAYVGDFDDDCDVDFPDFAVLASAWLSADGQPRYNPVCDISIPLDAHINWRDLDIFTDNWLAEK